MASIHKEFVVNTQPEVVWAAFRDFGALALTVLAPWPHIDRHMKLSQKGQGVDDDRTPCREDAPRVLRRPICATDRSIPTCSYGTASRPADII